MSPTLVILAHPNLPASRVNSRWLEALLLDPEQITVHDLYAAYPDGNIDVLREQNQLERYDRIILQFPLYWYSYPPLLKKWFDDVFAHGWAYGSSGDKLQGKVFGAAISIGDKRLNYAANGGVSFSVDEILAPFKATLRHVGATELPFFALFGASFQASDEEVEQSAKDYARHVLGDVCTARV